MKNKHLTLSCLFTFVTIVCTSCIGNDCWKIQEKENTVLIRSGILQQELVLLDSLLLSAVYVDANVSKAFVNEFSFVLWKASPNEEPQGLAYMETGVEQRESVKNQTDALNIEQKKQTVMQHVSWNDSMKINSAQAGKYSVVSYEIEHETKDEIRLSLQCEADKNKEYAGIKFNVTYQIFKGFPAIRKWITVKNESADWVKIDQLLLSENNISANYPSITHLTPELREIDPAIIAFSNTDASQGIILLNEVPSKLRVLDDRGNAGYHSGYFEWMLGPGESFQSEPVSMFAFDDDSFETISSVSTALDRCVEKELRDYFKLHILMPSTKSVAPLFCTWTNYASSINDRNLYQAVDIAAGIGFKSFQLDAGWSDTGPAGGWAVSDRKPDTTKLADMKSLSTYIQSKGMETGLWYSVFMNEKQAMQQGASPVPFSIPLIKRAGGLGISFAYQKSRDKYADDLSYLNKTFGVTYFKQDLSNICYGDIAKGHESRTLKESYLKGLRGLFTAQDNIHAVSPDVLLQLSHEIYWQTPGPAADIAVLQHADIYHIPPNEYWGAGRRTSLVDDSWNMDKDSLSSKLLEGCFRARNLWYAHRGLPLERLEVFGAVTTNYQGSLTPKIQDRQICSWLMGAPSSFSGDLTSLSAENIERYRERFELLEMLQQKYDIYSNFQYSGVPAPTDEDWHWWGKLNKEESGIVIILRGSKGEDARDINIPWVSATQRYRVIGLISGLDFGILTGKQLQAGELKLTLSPYGQEIIEIINQKY